MILRVDFMKDFGIFRNFNWSSIPDIEDFKEKNIIYGWNYCGKTTFSRLFCCLRDKVLPSAHLNSKFKLTYDKGYIDDNSISSFPYNVAVYNSEYAKENLRLEYDENINAIFFEVGDNAKISEQVTKLTALIEAIEGTESIKGKKEKYQKAINDFNDFENLFTQEASKIKNTAFSSLIEFNKGHLKRIRDKIIADIEVHIITSKNELSTISKTIKIEEPRSKIDNIIFDSSFSEIVKSANYILKSVPSKSDVINILDKNMKAFEWAKVGIQLHSAQDNCLFCGNKLSDRRYQALINFFENESSKLKEKVALSLNLIFIEERKLDSINLPFSINDLNDGFQEEFQKKLNGTNRVIVKYRTLLNKISTALKRKSTEKIYTLIKTEFKEDEIKLLSQCISELNELINRNNEFVDNFETIIEKEREKYKNHLVALFLKQSKYLHKQTKNDSALRQIEKLDEKVLKYTNEILRLNSLKESDAEGCIQFNYFVQSFLSRDDIRIELNKTTKKFNLLRGKVLAQNLSEGEKTAIAFSHFLVNLKSIEQTGKLNNYIIYIDDPISSLDSNHIFQVNSLLKDIFFDKIPNPLQPVQLMWKLKCKQLFISTHNFEFFNLLKELPKQKGFEKKEARYFICRMKKESIIQKLPKVYDTFASEYHFLFSEIYSFNQEINKSSSPKLFTIPNIVRRFLEMYTLTKYPSNEEVDARAEIVFGKRASKRILKLLHYFSHFNSIDRLHKHSEFVADIEIACNDVIKLIKTKDKMHYDALEASIK